MKNLQRWTPIGQLWDLQEEIDSLFKGLGRRNVGEANNDSYIWAPLVDIMEDKEAVILNAELPSLKKEDVKISIEDGVLTIRGERKFSDDVKKNNYHRIERSYGTFLRSFALPNAVEPDKVRANMKDGLLEIYIPKKDDAKKKEIEIQVS